MYVFLNTLSEYVAHLRDEAVERYPKLAEHPELLASAVQLLATANTADGASGASDDYEAMLNAAHAIAKSATATAFEIGERHAERAAHAWFSDALPREAVAVKVRPIDTWSELSKSVIATKRTKKGTHREVKRYGRSFVIGDTRGALSELQRPFPLDGLLEELKRTDGYADGITLAAIASSAYDVPLLGGEFKSWSEVLPADVSARLGAEPYSYSVHTSGPYIGTNERQPVKFPTRSPKLPKLSYRKRLSDPSDRSDIATRITKLVTACDRVVVRTVVHGRTERDEAGRVTYHVPDRVAVRTAPTERLHDGNVTVQRSKSKSAQRSGTKRSYDEAFVIRERDTLSALVDIAAVLQRDRSAEWRCETTEYRGTLTLSKSGRYSGTVQGSDVRARGCRTITALAKQLAPAFSA